MLVLTREARHANEIGVTFVTADIAEYCMGTQAGPEQAGSIVCPILARAPPLC